MSLNSILADWRSPLKAFNDVPVVDPTPSIPTIKMENGDLVPILDISPKQICQFFVQQKQMPPTVKQKLTNKYADIVIRWEKVYSLAFVLFLRMRNLVVLAWSDHQIAPFVKRKRFLSRISYSPARNPSNFGSTSFPG